MIGLEALNAAEPAAFVEALAHVFENARWVPKRAAEVRPFPTVVALHQALFDEVLDASEVEQLEFLNGHPDLAGTAARQRSMGAHSTAEQAALGLDRLDDTGFARFAALNAAYRDRFGFPFMICVRRHSETSIQQEFARRLDGDPAAELAAALQEVFWITRLRVAGLVTGPGMPEVGGVLSTHVLDTARGRPGAGVKVEVFALDDAGGRLLHSGLTNADGRLAPMDDGGPLRIGVYELRFHAGAYFAARGEAGCFDVIPVRIVIAEPEAHYHLPLLMTPWTYTTYRGS